MEQIETPEVEIKSGKDLREFFMQNPGLNKNAYDRKKALRVGDFFEVDMDYFRSWHGEDQQEDENAKPAQDCKTATLKILEIGDNTVRVEAGGITKTVFASLVFNYFKPAGEEINLEAKDGKGGVLFGKS